MKRPVIEGKTALIWAWLSSESSLPSASASMTTSRSDAADWSPPAAPPTEGCQRSV